MKKIMLTLTIALATIAGTTYAQAPAGEGTEAAEKKAGLNEMSKEEREKIALENKKKRMENSTKVKAIPAKKAKLMKHKEEIKSNADSKSEAKDYIQEKRKVETDATKKEKVIAHKDQIIEKAGSEEAAKAKLKRKNDKRKNNE